MPRNKESQARAKIKTPVPKTKTFTGCWTCRGRKVKCDGIRPKCDRCRKAARECGGYNFKLYWITEQDDGVMPSAIRRQAMAFGGSSAESSRTRPMGLDEVDRLLADIDDYESVFHYGQIMTKGPFSMFDASRSVDLFGSDGPFHDTTTTPSSRSEEVDLDDQQLDLRFRMAASSRHLSTSLDIQLLPSLNPSIFRDSITDILVANYVLEVANILTPLPHPENPYASIYVPKALDGAAAVECALESIPSSVSPSNVAIFYALMATSAFHLQSIEQPQGFRFDMLARDLRGKAMGYLRQALDELSVDEIGTVFVGRSRQSLSTAEATISAMLNLITIDIVEGSMSEYRIHLAGIERFSSQLRKKAELTPQIKQLLTISSFLTTIADTTSFDLQPLPWTETWIESPDAFSDNPDFEYGLEFTYGITPTLLSFMRRIVALSQNISYYTARSRVFPSSLTAACQSVSESLAEWSIEEEPLASMFSGPEMHVTLRLAKNHIMAFASALRVYYHTRILPCSPGDMNLYVRRTARHLMQIEQIKANAGLNKNAGTTITWPGFVAACEASKGPTRDVWYTWWEDMTKHSIGNIASLWEIVQKTWYLRDNRNSVEVPGWMPILRESGKHILAV